MMIVAIGLGMIFSFIFTETVGLAAGGVVVPGYIALGLHRPFEVFATVLVAIVTYLIVKLISHYVLLYGRRLLIVCVLIGYLLGYATRLFPPIVFSARQVDLTTIGFVIPGLLAYWMNRQGILETVISMTIIASLVRLIVIVLSNGVIAS